jgi:hypothetical protein
VDTVKATLAEEALKAERWKMYGIVNLRAVMSAFSPEKFIVSGIQTITQGLSSKVCKFF